MSVIVIFKALGALIEFVKLLIKGFNALFGRKKTKKRVSPETEKPKTIDITPVKPKVAAPQATTPVAKPAAALAPHPDLQRIIKDADAAQQKLQSNAKPPAGKKVQKHYSLIDDTITYDQDSKE